MIQQYTSPVRVYKHPFPLVMMTHRPSLLKFLKKKIFVHNTISCNEAMKKHEIPETHKKHKEKVDIDDNSDSNMNKNDIKMKKSWKMKVRMNVIFFWLIKKHGRV